MSQNLLEPLQVAGLKEDQRPDGPSLHRVRWTEDNSHGQTVLLEFVDPIRRKAVVVSTPLDSPPAAPASLQADTLEILTAPPGLNNDARWRDGLRAWIEQTAPSMAAPSMAAPSLVTVKIQDAQVWWRPGAAVVFAAPQRIGPLLLGLVDFAYHEGELRKLEQEIAASWPELEEDSPLAYDVNADNFAREKILGSRMQQALRRRQRHARIEPHLLLPAAHLPAPAQSLGERLREEARTEDRLEILDGQIEACEQVYEMSSQRMGEYRNSRREFILECLIIVLLAAETIIMLAELCWSLQE
jgi:hypothetical protein